jgi:hypothetical protein
MKTANIYNHTLNKTHIKNTFILFAFLLLIVTSCKKEKFPDPKQLQGTWTEINEKPNKHQLRFENEIIYFIKQNTIDTLIFRLDDKEEKMFLKLQNPNYDTETQHRIKINRKRDEITVWNLFATTNFETETTFKKD